MPRSFASLIRRRTVLGGALAWGATIAAPFPIRARGEAPVKLGMVEPLTGVYAQLAAAEVEGARLALEEVAGAAAFSAARCSFWSRIPATTPTPALPKPAS